ncbi:MAG: hypothetical protein RL308_2103 [Bacteroidota bacterium]|jgi:hypothetical protein
MKNLITICLLIAATFTIKAQDGKPSKEQTIEYLKAVLIDQKGGYSFLTYDDNNRLTNKVKAIYELTNITLDNCILICVIKKTETLSKSTSEKLIEPAIVEIKSREFDLSSIESFEFEITKWSDDITDYNGNLALNYSLKNKKQYTDIFCFPENTEKVLKALNHLRKLCSAPEPIKFD